MVFSKIVMLMTMLALNSLEAFHASPVPGQDASAIDQLVLNLSQSEVEPVDSSILSSLVLVLTEAVQSSQKMVCLNVDTITRLIKILQKSTEIKALPSYADASLPEKELKPTVVSYPSTLNTTITETNPSANAIQTDLDDTSSWNVETLAKIFSLYDSGDSQRASDSSQDATVAQPVAAPVTTVKPSEIVTIPSTSTTITEAPTSANANQTSDNTDSVNDETLAQLLAWLKFGETQQASDSKENASVAQPVAAPVTTAEPRLAVSIPSTSTSTTKAPTSMTNANQTSEDTYSRNVETLAQLLELLKFGETQQASDSSQDATVAQPVVAPVTTAKPSRIVTIPSTTTTTTEAPTSTTNASQISDDSGSMNVETLAQLLAWLKFGESQQESDPSDDAITAQPVVPSNVTNSTTISTKESINVPASNNSNHGNPISNPDSADSGDGTLTIKVPTIQLKTIQIPVPKTKSIG